MLIFAIYFSSVLFCNGRLHCFLKEASFLSNFASSVESVLVQRELGEHLSSASNVVAMVVAGVIVDLGNTKLPKVRDRFIALIHHAIID